MLVDAAVPGVHHHSLPTPATDYVVGVVVDVAAHPLLFLLQCILVAAISELSDSWEEGRKEGKGEGEGKGKGKQYSILRGAYF